MSTSISNILDHSREEGQQNTSQKILQKISRWFSTCAYIHQIIATHANRALCISNGWLQKWRSTSNKEILKRKWDTLSHHSLIEPLQIHLNSKLDISKLLHNLFLKPGVTFYHIANKMSWPRDSKKTKNWFCKRLKTLNRLGLLMGRGMMLQGIQMIWKGMTDLEIL